MKTPLIPTLMLLALAAALYLAPDGAFRTWRLYLHGSFARLFKPADGSDSDERVAYPVDRELRDRLVQLNAEIASLNARIRDLGLTREKIPETRIVPARIISLGPNATLDTYTINAGGDDGVRVGDAVVVGQAVAGVVTRCEPRASLVLSISSPGCYLSVRLGPAESPGLESRELCAVQGLGRDGVKIVLFSTGSVARPGWVAMTSGLEKGIPEGLLVGVVASDFSEGTENGTLEAELKPQLDLLTLDYVTVVKRVD